MRKTFILVTLAAVLLSPLSAPVQAQSSQNHKPRLFEFRLGNEVLYSRYHHLIEGKRVGLITNQSGVNSQGQSTIDVLASDPAVNLVALYGPEHGIDGTAVAGAWVESYIHPTLNIPVYSLYGPTRKPTGDMLEGIDVLLYDVQDIGSRTYTYISTLRCAMEAAKECGKTVIVLDRPNPVGCEIVEAPVLEDYYQTFVGIDNLPMAHGMTVGELARFFNRNIGVNLRVVPMEGYTRDMIYQDTGLEWVPTSPNIPDIDSVFGYMATGLGEGTGIRQDDKFKWIGGAGIDSSRFAGMLNGAHLPGVEFIPENKGSQGGVRLKITDYHTFNPAKTGLYALAYARQLNNFTVPKSGSDIVMFDKVMGTNRVGQWLEQKLSPQEIESRYRAELEQFKRQREQYLIYGYTDIYAGKPGHVGVVVNNVPLFLDSAPYIDSNNRTMVPVRAISEAIGAEVDWDPARYQVTIANGESSVKLVIGNPAIEVNGEKHTMDTVPVIRNNRTMVPLRYVGEFLGVSIGWDGANRIATVTQEQ
ncbi:MAG TPA: DUF1343 domain-containing protein [Firmicutes bacterium]|nr:DUF1343 domain-containing protein [Candidatus Fermentithermobacillaceae bacterium]